MTRSRRSVLRSHQQTGRRARDCNAGRSPWLLLAIICVAPLLTGCLHSGAPAPVLAGLAAAVAAVLDKLKKDKGLWFDEGDIPDQARKDLNPAQRESKLSEDKHRGFFIYRRAQTLGAQHPDWVSAGAPYTKLLTRVESDFEETEEFHAAAFSGQHSLASLAPDGSSDAQPNEAFRCASYKHIDIANVARIYTSKPASKSRVKDQQRFRRTAASSIIWRAAAIHATVPAGPESSVGLWDETKPDETQDSVERLNTSELKVLLDRRLRMVERMRFQVNWRQNDEDTRVIELGPGGNDRGPWNDDVRVSMFEYPTLDVDDVELTGDPPDKRIWRKDADEIRWEWVRPAGRVVVTRIGDEPGSDPTADNESKVWVPNDKDERSYMRFFAPDGGTTFGQSMEGLMQPDLNFWKRSWLYCDHVCCLLHYDALRFALQRKLGDIDEPGFSPDDDEFNAIPSGLVPEGAKQKLTILGGILGEVPFADRTTDDVNVLTNDGQGKDAVWFENMFVDNDDLQVGDHTIFYNHVIYLAMFSGAFKLENAVVSEVASDPRPGQGGIRPLGLVLEGHGMRARSVAGFQERMAVRINKGFKRLRADALAAAATISEGKALINWRNYFVLPWKPYPNITWDQAKVAGPWWVYIEREPLGEIRPKWPDVPTMTDAIALSVSAELPDSGKTADFNAPPPRVDGIRAGESATFAVQDIKDGVLFPLYLPFLSDGTPLTWREYFERRRSNPSLAVTLKEYELPSGCIPGFFVGGRVERAAQVVRPKVPLPKLGALP